MGNAQSSHLDPLRHQLPSALASDLDSSPPSSIPATPQSTWRDKQETRRQIRQTLFGSSPDDLGQAIPLKHSSPSLLESAASEPLRNSPKILQHAPQDGRPLSVEDVAGIIQRIRKTATAEDLHILQQALLSSDNRSKDNLATTNADDPLSPIASRGARLAAVPGTATRKATFLRKKSLTKKHSKHQPQTWSPDMFVTSPLSQIAGMSSVKQDADKPVLRSATPLSVDVPQLGTHQLGSLRVTNGPASPEPSIKSGITSQKPVGLAFQQTDYFTPPESSASDASPGTRSASSSPFLLTPNEEQAPSTSDNELPEWHFVGENPSQDNKQVTRESPHSISEEGIEDVPLSPPPAINLYSVEASSNPFLPENEDAKVQPLEAGDLRPEPNHEDNQVSHRANLPEPVAADDESVYSERILEHSGNLTREDSRAQALNALSGTSSDGHGKVSLSGRKQPGYVESLKSCETLRGNSPKSIAAVAHFDSQSSLKRVATPPERRNDDYSHRASHLRDGGDRQAQTRYSQGLQVSLRPQHDSFCDARRVADFSPSDPLPASHKSPQRKIDSSVEAPSPLGNLARSTPEGKSRPKKLIKKRAMSERNLRASIIVQGQREVECVPDVPFDVAIKYSQRMSKNPTMEHLEHTYDSVSTCETRQSSPVTPTTPHVDIRFPSPTPSPDDSSESRKSRRPQKRSSIGPDSGNRMFRRRSSKSLERRRSRRQSRELDAQAVISVADFGTVAESLGTSPYDIAIKETHGHGNRPRRQTPSLPPQMHPHQITNRQLANKRTAGWDEKAAAQWARQRSRDRLAPHEAHADFQREPLPTTMPAPSKTRPPLRSIFTDAPRLAPPGKKSLSRPKTMEFSYGSSTYRNENADPRTAHDKHQYPDFDGDRQPNKSKDATPRTETSPDPDMDPAWQAQAKLWRQRRKSIGEGLLLQSFLSRPDSSPADQTPCFPQSNKPTAAPASPTEATPLFFEALTDVAFTSPEKSDANARAGRSQSPTIAARAKFFEKAAERQREEGMTFRKRMEKSRERGVATG